MHLVATLVGRIRARFREESGATLIIFALSLIVLFGFMALAVDAGHAFVERRESQNTADVAALAGGVQLIGHEGTDAEKEADMIAEVQRVVSANLGSVDWSTCSDPAPLANTWSTSNCISWSYEFRLIRVKVPDRSIETYFAGIIGFDSVDVAAAATVQAAAPGLGGVLPFGILSETGVLCLKTVNAEQKLPPNCTSAETGNFGYLDFTEFGGRVLGVDEECTGDIIGRLGRNIANGLDHYLEEYESGVSTELLDLTKCQDQEVPGDPNGAEVKTGNAYTPAIYPGFVSGIDVFDGRLTNLNTNKAGSFDWGGHISDDLGLWEYLTASAKAYCEDTYDDANSLQILAGTGRTTPDPLSHSLKWTAIDQYVDTEEEIISCMQFARADVIETWGVDTDDDPIYVLDEAPLSDPTDDDSWAAMGFSDLDSKSPQSEIFTGLKDSPRFASVPLLDEDDWPPGGSAPMHFRTFIPIYIQTLFGDCKNNVCDVVFEPGGEKTGEGGSEISAVTALYLHRDLLNAEDEEFLEGPPEIEEYLLYE